MEIGEPVAKIKQNIVARIPTSSHERAGLWVQVLKLLFCLALASLVGCSSIASSRNQITRKSFGKTKDGTEVYIFTLRNEKSAEARISNYGGLVVSLKVPDRNGQLGDVVLGYDDLAGYLKETPYFGALIGRYGNRIARGKFTLDGEEYTLATNNYPNALHGGNKGFDKVVWEPTIWANLEGPALKLSYTSKDGEEGYPGNLKVTVIYTLTHDNALRVDYTATTDKDTVVNLTQHSYFNLAGSGDILKHVVMMPADKFTPVDSTLIPTGELRPVDGTPFDFRTPTAIGARINQDDEQLKFGKGYDHNWVFNKAVGQLTLMARVTESTSGRALEVYSTEPGLQFYSGNFLDGTLKGKGGWVYQFRDGFCMEPQHFPDSPNKPQFPSVVLKPGQTYRNTIIYKFSTQ
jgi:aldose 1-epimerase